MELAKFGPIALWPGTNSAMAKVDILADEDEGEWDTLKVRSVESTTEYY